MKVLLALFALAFVLFLILSPMVYFGHEEAVDQREWRDFSAVHHCRITRRPATWHEVQADTWTCDGGFEVVR